MSTPQPPVTQPPAFIPFNFDSTKFEAKIVEIKEHQLTFAGKHNHNPFTWIAKNITPYELAYVKGERSKELYDHVMNLTSVAPKINPMLPDVAPNTSASPQPTNAPMQPQGLTGLTSRK